MQMANTSMPPACLPCLTSLTPPPHCSLAPMLHCSHSPLSHTLLHTLSLPFVFACVRLLICSLAPSCALSRSNLWVVCARAPFRCAPSFPCIPPPAAAPTTTTISPLHKYPTTTTTTATNASFCCCWLRKFICLLLLLLLLALPASLLSLSPLPSPLCPFSPFGTGGVVAIFNFSFAFAFVRFGFVTANFHSFAPPPPHPCHAPFYVVPPT